MLRTLSYFRGQFSFALCFLVFGLLISNVSSAPETQSSELRESLKSLIEGGVVNIEMIKDAQKASEHSEEKQLTTKPESAEKEPEIVNHYNIQNHHHDHEHNHQDEDEDQGKEPLQVLSPSSRFGSKEENKANSAATNRGSESKELNHKIASPLFSFFQFFENHEKKLDELDSSGLDGPEELKLSSNDFEEDRSKYEDLVSEITGKSVDQDNEDMTEPPTEMDTETEPEKRIIQVLRPDPESYPSSYPMRFPRIGAGRPGSYPPPYPMRFPRMGYPRIQIQSSGAPEIMSTDLFPSGTVPRFPKTRFVHIHRNRKPLQIVVVKDKTSQTVERIGKGHHETPTEQEKGQSVCMDKKIHLACLILLLFLTIYALCYTTIQWIRSPLQNKPKINWLILSKEGHGGEKMEEKQSEKPKELELSMDQNPKA